MFEELSQAKQQLRKDKHTLLEGYVTEYLFERQFLRSPGNRRWFADYTCGWWSAETGDRRFFFFVSPWENDVDRSVAQTLSPHYEVWRAYPEGDVWHFYKGTQNLDLDQFRAAFGLAQARPEGRATELTRDGGRQDRCLAFFEEAGLLQKIAVERNFADDILSVYFDSIVNIDFFVKKPSGKLGVIEVKFKFESASKTFGINVGQYHMFELLSGMGMEIEHWILYNKTHDKNLSIFGFLDLDGKKWWRSGTLHPDARGLEKSAPAETSVMGRKRQNYYEFDEDGFRFRAPLQV